MRTNLTSHDVKTYRYSCKYVITYHRVSDGLLSLRVTMWIEGLSLSVINRREKLATRLCVFCKTKNICLFIYFEKCTLKNTHVLLLCTKISLFLIFFTSSTTSLWPLKFKVHVFEMPPRVLWKDGFLELLIFLDMCVLHQSIYDVNNEFWSICSN